MCVCVCVCVLFLSEYFLGNIIFKRLRAHLLARS